MKNGKYRLSEEELEQVTGGMPTLDSVYAKVENAKKSVRTVAEDIDVSEMAVEDAVKAAESAKKAMDEIEKLGFR